MKLAIIDATAAPPGQPLCLPPTSRYATPIANWPLIGHVLDELIAAGITEARIVAGPRARANLIRLVGPSAYRSVELTYHEAGGQDGRRSVLAEVERALSSGPVLLHPGDSLFRGQVAAMGERFAAENVDAVIVDPAGSGPPRSEPEPRATPTVVVLGHAARPVLAELLSPGSEGHDLSDALQRGGCRLAVCRPDRHWRYGESTEALLAANRMLLDELPADTGPESSGEGNRLHGRIDVSPTARISDCVLHGPIAIDDGAVVEDSYVGPYTSIGAQAVLSGAEIENAMVLQGAQIRHPGCRLEGSIVGQRARVSRSFALPKGLHVRLGPESELDIS